MPKARAYDYLYKLEEDFWKFCEENEGELVFSKIAYDNREHKLYLEALSLKDAYTCIEAGGRKVISNYFHGSFEMRLLEPAKQYSRLNTYNNMCSFFEPILNCKHHHKTAEFITDPISSSGSCSISYFIFYDNLARGLDSINDIPAFKLNPHLRLNISGNPIEKEKDEYLIFDLTYRLESEPKTVYVDRIPIGKIDMTYPEEFIKKYLHCINTYQEKLERIQFAIDAMKENMTPDIALLTEVIDNYEYENISDRN